MHNAIHGDTAHLLDFGASNRLAISNDRQRLQRRLRESRWTNLVPDQRLKPGRVFGLRDELPQAGYAGESVCAICLRVILRQFPQRFLNLIDGSLAKRFRSGIL